MSERVFNFNPGPAVLPVEVLETLRDNLLNYHDSGIGVLEMSHRSADFTEIINTAEADLRELLSIGDDYGVAFTTGGASSQFSMAPLNLLGRGQVADYLVTGSWAKKALAEAKKFGETNVAASSDDKNFSYIPKKLNLSDNPAYVHFTSNNTIAGTQFSSEPQVGSAVLLCDASSDFLHKKIDINKYGAIYAGAQKNLGPAGVTVLVIRRDLLERTPDGVPVMLDYRTWIEKKSLYNTAPVFAIYAVAEVLKWLKRMGGLDVMQKRNEEKAAVLYQALDASDFYQAVAESDSRSLMNVTFRIKNQDLESEFIKQAAANGLAGLKGHRSVGGIRASIYNAFPAEGVDALVSFMREFEGTNG